MATLQEQIRGAAKLAEEESQDADFNPMSWLDLILDDNPDFFDGLFDTSWQQLSEDEKNQRAVLIRRVL